MNTAGHTTMEQSLIEYYRAIENSSLRMLEAAQDQDWDEVVRLEGACAVLIEKLRYQARSNALHPHQRAEKSKIMQRILHNDSQVRYLAEPWLADFESKFDVKPKFLH